MCVDSDVCAAKDFCGESFTKSSLKSRVCVGIGFVTARVNAALDIRFSKTRSWRADRASLGLSVQKA